jgi:uncharacterized membrane protein
MIHHLIIYCMGFITGIVFLLAYTMREMIRVEQKWREHEG